MSIDAKVEACEEMEVDGDSAEEAEERSPKLKKVVCDSGDVDKIRMMRRMRMIKGIVMSLTTPSYVLGLGNAKVRADNRAKLCNVLRKLVRQQNWKEASGVLSLVLRATTKDMCPRNNRIKYWAAMEIVKQCKGDGVKDIKRIFNAWIKKVTGSALDESITLQLEFILFSLTVGEGDSADIAAKDLRNYGENPLSHMVLGLTYYQSWYSTLPAEERLKKTDFCDTLGESDQSCPKIDSLIRYSVGSFCAANNVLEDQCHYDSEPSVTNGKKIVHDISDSPHEERSVDDDFVSEEEIVRQPVQTLRVYSPKNSEDDEVVDYRVDEHASIFATQGLHPWLLPLKLPVINSHKEFSRFKSRADHKDYERAVKHFGDALRAEPPMVAALVPLIQLLLLGDQVGEALQELEKFISDHGLALAFRLKASILEHFDHSNYAEQISCYEYLLKKDPTCIYALGKLMSLHRAGEYGSDSLIEMIALHLDATYAEYHSWMEFAICFSELSRLEEDRLSVCQNGDGHQLVQGVTMRIPKIFSDPKLAKSWSLRCKWWLNRHFGKKMGQEEIATGNLELLAYKAACGCHMYGRDFDYVLKVHSFLAKNEEDKELLHFLQMHMEHSVGFYSTFIQKQKPGNPHIGGGFRFGNSEAARSSKKRPVGNGQRQRSTKKKRRRCQP